MPIELIIIIVLGVGLFATWMLRAWQRMKSSEKLLDDIDHSKLKNLDEDGWDD